MAEPEVHELHNMQTDIQTVLKAWNSDVKDFYDMKEWCQKDL